MIHTVLGDSHVTYYVAMYSFYVDFVHTKHMSDVLCLRNPGYCMASAKGLKCTDIQCGGLLQLHYNTFQQNPINTHLTLALTGKIPNSKVHGAHLGPTGPRWAPCWPHKLCYFGYGVSFMGSYWFMFCLSDWSAICIIILYWTVLHWHSTHFLIFISDHILSVTSL